VAPARNQRSLTRTAVGAMRSIQKQPVNASGAYFQQKDVR